MTARPRNAARSARENPKPSDHQTQPKGNDMNAIVTTSTTTLPAVPATTSPWADFANDELGSAIFPGDLLKFKKGKFVRGENETIVAEGSEFTALPSELAIGWVRWVDGRPDRHVVGRIVDGFRKPARDSLGDNDAALWPIDPKGGRKDPWASAAYLVLEDSDGEMLTFSTSSAGGSRALARFASNYDKHRVKHPGARPRVKLYADSYRHAEYGEVHVPVIEIVGWEDAPATAAPPSGLATELNDDIPW